MTSKAPKRERFTVKQVGDALRRSAGIQASAAQKLGMSRPWICLYIQRHPELFDVIDEAKSEVVDMSESKLFEAIREGNMTAVIFSLKTLGKDRGYSERQELGGIDGRPLELVRRVITDPGGDARQVEVVEIDADSGEAEDGEEERGSGSADAPDAHPVIARRAV